jgi:hypothetical protein
MSGNEAWLNLIVQIPVVGIFIWFILEWTKRNNVAQIARDREWRDFMREERKSHADNLSQLVEEIKTIGNQVGTVSGILAELTFTRKDKQK